MVSDEVRQVNWEREMVRARLQRSGILLCVMPRAAALGYLGATFGPKEEDAWGEVCPGGIGWAATVRWYYYLY